MRKLRRLLLPYLMLTLNCLFYTFVFAPVSSIGFSCLYPIFKLSDFCKSSMGGLPKPYKEFRDLILHRSPFLFITYLPNSQCLHLIASSVFLFSPVNGIVFSSLSPMTKLHDFHII